MEEQTQISENFEIPSRWRRFSVYILDLIINITGIWLIINLIMIIFKKATLWNKVVWIIALNNKNNPINRWQSLLRYFIFNPAFLALILFSFKILIWYITPWGWCVVSRDSSGLLILDPSCGNEPLRTLIDISNWTFIVGIILYSISVIELFFKCPTFIDKWLWIKRIYKKSK